ncbi:lysylphosphatidylglycerol synthase transmembrane domain-containing protein [Portibacter marinus]|uniref:lysylphosphatidylglycerol synthase transmembrane domain-containing protein n=1 Tax=Portibacter marinus TaxID=2898660 RepID=UPI001F1BDC4C|nr:lysylphosphatidylglycerol synthase transmembrane domain-containing protein [Portibacter marinus]
MRGKKNIDTTLRKLRISRIILPICIGISVVCYLFWSHFDIQAFKSIDWGYQVFAWLLLGVLFYVIRHLAYSYRLFILSDKKLSLRKSAELIFIWEFATTISPTSLGGSAVAMIFLSLERLKTARAVTIVLYTIVLDTFFFVVSVPLLLTILGLNVIRPEIFTWDDMNGYGITFFIVFAIMLTYGFIFYYGLFHRPDQIKKLMAFFARRRILRRYKEKLIQTGQDIENSSRRLRAKSPDLHIKAILATFTAWIFKFALMFCIIYAFIDTVPRTLYHTFMIYGRYETMWAITAASPTPGGSGLAEYLFGGFYSDYVPLSLAVVVAFTWRIIAYYTYLMAGVIIVPAWIRKIYNRKKSVNLGE